jgi:hypothetical protein
MKTIYYVCGLLLLLLLLYFSNIFLINRETFTSDAMAKNFKDAKINLPFDEKKNDSLIKYFDSILQIAKSQLIQPEKGDQGEQGEQGDIGAAGGIYVRSGKLSGGKKSDYNKKSLSIGTTGNTFTTQDVMIAKMKPFNMSPDNDWLLLQNGQLKNNHKGKCMKSTKIDDTFLSEIVNCSIEKGDTTIPLDEKWEYKHGQLVSQDLKNSTKRKCLTLQQNGSTTVEPCIDNKESQMWWWN